MLTTAEASWHRRARRLRQNAKAVLAVERARRTLASHHGGGLGSQRGCLLAEVMPGGGGGADGGSSGGKQARFTEWDCHICGLAANHGWRTRCRNCGAYPKAEARRPIPGKGKGKGKGAEGGKGKNYSDDNLGTFASRQLQAARAAQSGSKELSEARKKSESLQAEVRRLQKEVQDAKLAALQKHKATSEWNDDGEGDAEGPEDFTEEERRARIDRIKNGLPYLEDAFGVDSAQYLAAQTELDAHQKAIREAKPYKTHRAILERRLDKLRRLQEKDKERLEELRDAEREIGAKITSTASAIEDREKEIEGADAELKELLLKAVNEDAPQQQLPGDGNAAVDQDPTRGWNAVVGTVANLVRAPGVPPEFTAQLEGVFGQLQGMVQLLQRHAAATQAGGATPGQPHLDGTPPAAAAPAPAAKPPTPPSPPIVLAPHGRFAKAAAKPSPTSPQPQPPSTTPGQGDVAKDDGAKAAPTVPAAAASAANASTSAHGEAAIESEDELQEAFVDGGAAMEVDVEDSLAKLPEQDQIAIRAALRRGGGRDVRGQERSKGDGETRREERERSPRPTKTGDIES